MYAGAFQGRLGFDEPLDGTYGHLNLRGRECSVWGVMLPRLKLRLSLDGVTNFSIDRYSRSMDNLRFCEKNRL
jgi:hypothetical protein